MAAPLPELHTITQRCWGLARGADKISHTNMILAFIRICTMHSAIAVLILRLLQVRPRQNKKLARRFTGQRTGYVEDVKSFSMRIAAHERYHGTPGRY